MRAALADLEYVHIYPDPESRALRQALSEFTGVPSEFILAGAGADELLDLTMRLFLLPGDAILNCPPTFGMYSFDAAIAIRSVAAIGAGSFNAGRCKSFIIKCISHFF